MPRDKKFKGDMTEIGQVRTPPFAVVPNIHELFENRHQRFERLAPTSPIKDYIQFLSTFCRAQHETAVQFSDIDISGALTPSANEFTMPPIDRKKALSLPAFLQITADFLNRLTKLDLPVESRLALDNCITQKAEWKKWAQNLTQHHLPVESMAQHIYIMGAYQIILSIIASRQNAKSLKPLDGNLCPNCGGTHSASMVVGWGGSEGTRFCSCLYCGTLWHFVRIKCTFCESTEGIAYQEIEGGPGTILAETCKKCQHYCKLIDHEKDTSFNVFADDIGSIALDLLMKQKNLFSRGAFNPFLAGF